MAKPRTNVMEIRQLIQLKIKGVSNRQCADWLAVTAFSLFFCCDWQNIPDVFFSFEAQMPFFP